jgi:dephospho-CoA kinase
LGNGLRALFQDFWIIVLRNRLIEDNPKGYIVTDCRFENELKMLQELDVGEPWYRKSVFISANKRERIKRMKQRDGSCDESRLNDVSETSVDSLKSMCDYTINNSKGLDHLQLQVDKINADIQREKNNG